MNHFIDQNNTSTEKKSINIRTIFGHQYRKQMVAGTFFVFFRQFGGSAFFTFYSVDIFENVGQDGSKVNLICNISDVFGSILGLCIGKFIIKRKFITGMMLQGITL